MKQNFWLFKSHCERIKRQTIAYKKIFANDIPNVGSVSRMYKEISELNNKKATNLIKKWSKLWHFTKDTCMVNMHWKMLSSY